MRHEKETQDEKRDSSCEIKKQIIYARVKKVKNIMSFNFKGIGTPVAIIEQLNHSDYEAVPQFVKDGVKAFGDTIQPTDHSNGISVETFGHIWAGCSSPFVLKIEAVYIVPEPKTESVAASEAVAKEESTPAPKESPAGDAIEENKPESDAAAYAENGGA